MMQLHYKASLSGHHTHPQHAELRNITLQAEGLLTPPYPPFYTRSDTRAVASDRRWAHEQCFLLSFSLKAESTFKNTKRGIVK